MICSSACRLSGLASSKCRSFPTERQPPAGLDWASPTGPPRFGGYGVSRRRGSPLAPSYHLGGLMALKLFGRAEPKRRVSATAVEEDFDVLEDPDPPLGLRWP